MENVLLVIHLIITLALIVTILLQRSEGGGLVNQSGGLGSFASARTAGNLLTRTTAILATLFFISNLSLAVLAKNHGGTDDVLSAVEASESETAPATPPVDSGDTPVKAKDATPEKAPAAPLAD